MRNLLIMLALFSSIAVAGVYVSQTPNGGTEYSDTPTDNASKMDIPAVSSITTTRTPESSTPAQTANVATPSTIQADSAAVKKPVEYKVFEIESPKDQETIQNQNMLAVQIKMDPPTQAGDNIQVYLDGKAVGVATASVYHELGVVDRGTHTLYAEIINSNKQAIKRTPAITIFVHRNSVITSPQSR